MEPVYYFGLEKLKDSPNKVELVEAVTGLFREDWKGIVQREGNGGSIVKK